MNSSLSFRRMALALAIISAGFSSFGWAQTCLTSDEIDAATKSAIQNTATRYFDMVSRGDSASLKQSAIPALASNFGGLEGTIKENQASLAGSHATPRAPYVLKA